MNLELRHCFPSSLWMLGVLSLLPLAAPHGLAQQCGSASNFQSTCTSAGSPRQFQCSIQVTPQVPGITAVRLQGQSGIFNGQSQIDAPVQNGVATFNFHYQEGQAINPNVNMMIHLLNASNLPVCRFPFAGPLAACAQPGGCTATTANLWLIGGAPMYENRASLANYRGPAITLLVGGTSGPNTPNLARISYEILGAERRSVCNNNPGPWHPAMLPPANAQQGGWNPAVYNTPAFNTAVHVVNRSIQSGFENGLHVLVPVDKLNNACSEQYRFSVRVRLTFANGCEVMQDFNNLMVTRP